MENDTIKKAAALLRECNRLFFITGAGISADSGLPTYRGIGGLYTDTVTDEGIPIEEALCGDMMNENPALIWKYLVQMEQACRRATFNRGHEVIAEMERAFECVWTLTQNVDGFHRKAGSRNCIDIHGDLHELSCMSCDHQVTVDDYSGLEIPPRCSVCGGIMRPDVVLFGELLSLDKCDLLTKVWREGFDIVFSVGTTSVFPYIAQPVALARQMGIPTVEINPGQTSVSSLVDIKIAGRAAETLDLLWTMYHNQEKR